MLREIQQVLRLVLLLRRQRQRRRLRSAAAGGLLVLLWTKTGASGQCLNCSVAAAGPWCTGITVEALQAVLTELEESRFPCAWPCPHSDPDPEDLSAFTHLNGPLRFLLTFQMKDGRLFSPESYARIKAFLHMFSLTHAWIQIDLKLKLSQQTFQREFRVKMKSRVVRADQPTLILGVTSSTHPPEHVKRGCWCQRGHPVVGDRLPLSIPPAAMDQGLFGELSLQTVALLSPCVLQYPNLATQLSRIQVLVYSPNNIPITEPSAFLQNLPAHLDCQELGLHGLQCSSKDLAHNGGTVYTVKQGSSEDPDQDPEQEPGSPPMRQSLLLCLLLQHSDPFTCQLADIMVTEVLIERHLEDILNNNRLAVTAALQTELKKTLRAQKHRKKDQEKLQSAAEVILSSSISIVSCSSNVDFRNACLNAMKVCDTQELSLSLRESLRRVTSWKFVPRSSCSSSQMEEHPEGDEPIRREI